MMRRRRGWSRWCSSAVPTGLGQGIELAAAMAVLVYEWFIARTALLLPGVTATLLVLIDILLGTAVSRVTDSLY